MKLKVNRMTSEPGVEGHSHQVPLEPRGRDLPPYCDFPGSSSCGHCWYVLCSSMGAMADVSDRAGGSWSMCRAATGRALTPSFTPETVHAFLCSSSGHLTCQPRGLLSTGESRGGPATAHPLG